MIGRCASAAQSAVAALREADPTELSDAELGAELVELRTLASAVEAAFSRRLAVFDRRQAFQADGALSAQSWLRSHTRMSPAEASAAVRLARELPAQPATASAFEAGEISSRHAGVITRLAGDISGLVDAATSRAVADTLLDAARQVDATDLRQLAERLRDGLDADKAAARAERLHERRRLSVSTTFAGMVAIDGLLDPDGGAVVLAALTGLVNRERSRPRAAGEPVLTPAQARADGLVEAMRGILAAGGLPPSGSVRPQVLITVDLPTLLGCPEMRRTAVGRGRPGLGPEALRRLCCDAELSRVITDGPSEVLDVGRSTRTIPPALRRALIVRDRGCVFPGCDRPPEYTEAHHLRHWADGGRTDLHNTVLLCWGHHRLHHEHGWRIEWRPGGGLLFVRPDGRPVRPP